jgi:meso-butanediol dehydrogenase / (S,S)-butanediol dehydrogenase / diacetyl reductase
MPMTRFDDKVVIITAAASGIGLAAARRFAEAGATLSLCDIDLASLEQQGKALGLLSDRLRLAKVDVSRPSEIEALVSDTVARFGGLDVLVNNAGVGAFGYVTEITPEIWERVIATTLSSVFYASRAALPHLIKRRGNIVNTASISGLAADVGFTAYNAAKGGVVNLTRAMAIDHASDGIRVNALCPGVVEAGSTAWMVKNEALMRGFADRVPMGRMAQPDEMAGAILFLASDDASYMTGSNMVVDGGLLAGTGQPKFRKIIDKAGW